jgi:hypothetical protein
MEVDARKLYAGQGFSSLFTYCVQKLHLSEHAALPVPAATRPPEIKPLAPVRYKVQFTVSRETYERLRRVQDLMRHIFPTGDRAEIFDRSLTLLLAKLLRTKLADTERAQRPRAAKLTSRHIPASVKREVWRRDAGRCAFQGEQGRCAETGFLEFHHVVPYADRGESSAINLELRCRAHNQHEADRCFGVAEPSEAREDGAYFGTSSNSVRTELAPR